MLIIRSCHHSFAGSVRTHRRAQFLGTEHIRDSQQAHSAKLRGAERVRTGAQTRTTGVHHGSESVCCVRACLHLRRGVFEGCLVQIVQQRSVGREGLHLVSGARESELHTAHHAWASHRALLRRSGLLNDCCSCQGTRGRKCLFTYVSPVIPSTSEHLRAPGIQTSHGRDMSYMSWLPTHTCVPRPATRTETNEV